MISCDLLSSLVKYGWAVLSFKVGAGHAKNCFHYMLAVNGALPTVVCSFLKKKNQSLEEATVPSWKTTFQSDDQREVCKWWLTFLYTARRSLLALSPCYDLRKLSSLRTKLGLKVTGICLQFTPPNHPDCELWISYHTQQWQLIWNWVEKRTANFIFSVSRVAKLAL